MPHVCTKSGWPGVFHRTIPGAKKDDPCVFYQFHPGITVELTKREVTWLEKNGDIPNALEIVSESTAARQELAPSAVEMGETASVPPKDDR